MHLIYEGNKYEFDIPNGVTVSYIKDLISKIFHHEEKDLNIMYNEENLLNYNNKVLISTIVPKGEKTMIIHLDKKESLLKNIINSSNVSTSDTNVNDKFYKSMRQKFMKFNSSYNIIKEILNFSSNLESIIKKIIKNIKSFQDNVINVNNQLNKFYNNKDSSKLIEAFEEKHINNLNEKELKDLNNEIESYVLNYKYIITQHNFQNNIIEFILEMNNKFKLGKINFLKLLKEESNYEDIISSLDNIFKELLPNEKIKLNKLNEINNVTNTNYLMTEPNELIKKKKKIFFDFPKIENTTREKTSNHFYTKSDKNFLNNSYGKTIKLLKKTMINSSHKNLSLPFFKLNNQNSNKISPIISNKNSTRNFLPGLEKLKSIDTKTLDSSTTETKKKRNVVPKNSPIKNKFEDYDNIRNQSNNINDKINQSMNIDVKPKIMDKDIKKKLLSRNEKIDTTPNNKTVNNIFDDNKNNGLINLKPSKKNLNKNLALYNHSISKDFFQDNKNYLLTEREKEKENNISNNKDINNSKTNNNSINNDFHDKSKSESKEFKTKFKIVKNNSKEKKNNNDNEKREKKEEKKNQIIKSLNEKDISKFNINNKFNSTIQSSKTIDVKKKNTLKSLSPDSIVSLQENLKKNDLEGKKNKFGKTSVNFGEKDDKSNKKKKKENKNDINDKKSNNNKSLFKEKINDNKSLINERNNDNEEKETKKNSKSKKKHKENIENIEDKDIIINHNKRENNKEQIEKLTKDLFGNGKAFTNSQIPEIIKKYYSKGNNSDNEKEKEKEKENEKEKEKEKEKESDENEKEINLNDVKTEKNDEEAKKKRKRLINVYDFII